MRTGYCGTAPFPRGLTPSEQREAIALWNQTFDGVWFYWLIEDELEEPDAPAAQDPADSDTNHKRQG